MVSATSHQTTAAGERRIWDISSSAGTPRSGSPDGISQNASSEYMGKSMAIPMSESRVVGQLASLNRCREQHMGSRQVAWRMDARQDNLVPGEVDRV